MAASSTSAPPPLTPGSAPRARRIDPLQRNDGLTKGQLRAVIVAIAAIHVGGGWGLMQIPAVREAVLEAAPVFVNFIPAPEPPKPEVPPPPPPPPRPVPKTPAPPAALVTTRPAPAPAPFVAPPPPPEPAPAPPPLAPEVPPAPPAPAPPSVAIELPKSAARYRIEPKLRFPPISNRLREYGTTLLSVHIAADGTPDDVRVKKSSGFARLDAEAIRATREARFYPPEIDGKSVTGWVTVPAQFTAPE
jgi:protein TonB